MLCMVKWVRGWSYYRGYVLVRYHYSPFSLSLLPLLLCDVETEGLLLMLLSLLVFCDVVEG